MLFIFDHLTSHGEEMLKFSTIMFLFTHICFFFLRFIIILFDALKLITHILSVDFAF